MPRPVVLSALALSTLSAAVTLTGWIYSGELDGEKSGVALFDRPSSFHHPARWHVRDCGLLAANPFGANACNNRIPALPVTL